MTIVFIILFCVSIIVNVRITKRALQLQESRDEIFSQISSSLVTMRTSLDIINKATRTEVAFNDPVVRNVVRAVHHAKVSLEKVIENLESDTHDDDKKKEGGTPTAG